MCTVTIVPTPSGPAGYRMACSRDEQHGRTPAQPPQNVRFNGINALMPIDPHSGGTWVGVNEAGLSITLLNYNPPVPPIGRDRSRGLVIPALLGSQNLDDLLSHASTIERERMMPFRLLACDGRKLLAWRSTEPIDEAQVTQWDRLPVMLTSSGLGDHLVQTPRRALFESWFGETADDYLQRQLAFHQHRWPGREHLSICMHRDDARTVSYTTIDVADECITMNYHPDRPDRPAQDITEKLQRRLVQR